MATVTGRRLVAVGLVLVLLGGSFAASPGVVAATSHAPSITSFDYTGEGSVETGTNVTYLWQSAEHTFDVVIETGESPRDVEVCLRTANGGPADASDLACVDDRLPANSSATVTLTLEAWPSNATGQQTVFAVVVDPGSGDDLADEEMGVTVLEQDGDMDADGLSNTREVEAGTRIDANDTDDDGLLDGEEVDTYGTDPTQSDTDGDGLPDRVEVNRTQTDSLKADTDGDGLTDDLEVNKYGTNPNKPDTDGDGLTDKEEVNSYQTDPLKADSDGDSLADAAEVNEYDTDPNTRDTDGDDIIDGEEVHVYHTDPTKSDTDGDGLNDTVEIRQYQTDPTLADTDDDGLEDGPELEIYDTNPVKADTDGDGLNDGREVERGTDPTVPNENIRDGPFATLGLRQVPFSSVITGVAILGLVAVLSFRYGTLGRFADRFGSTGTDSAPLAGDDGDDGTPPPITARSKPQQVLELLDENGGRMRQSDIVSKTGWSKSTVSRTLSKMEESGDVTKIDVGRGNIIARPGSEPEHSGSPHER